MGKRLPLRFWPLSAPTLLLRALLLQNCALPCFAWLVTKKNDKLFFFYFIFLFSTTRTRMNRAQGTPSPRREEEVRGGVDWDEILI